MDEGMISCLFEANFCDSTMPTYSKRTGRWTIYGHSSRHRYSQQVIATYGICNAIAWPRTGIAAVDVCNANAVGRGRSRGRAGQHRTAKCILRVGHVLGAAPCRQPSIAQSTLTLALVKESSLNHEGLNSLK